MRRLVVAALLLAPLAAVAADQCKFQAPRKLHLDLAGIHGVQFETHNQTLHVVGSDSATALDLDGRACASDASLLDSLQVTQRREGDQLIIELRDDQQLHIRLFGGRTAELEAKVQLPSGMPVTLNVGSGDADASGLRQLDSHVGSGDLHASHIAGRVSTSVGSGDVAAADIGSLEAGAVGSGDLKAADVHGDVKLGSIGSGDVDLLRVGGSVRAETLGSGDLNVRDVRGDLSLGSKGSGDVRHSGIGGKVNVPHDDD